MYLSEFIAYQMRYVNLREFEKCQYMYLSEFYAKQVRNVNTFISMHSKHSVMILAGRCSKSDLLCDVDKET